MSAETRRFTFLQVSDSHLDSKSLATAFPLTIAQRRMREAECLETLLRALSMAAERAVNAVLIPGDLWHNETVRASTVLKIIGAFDQLKGTPVIIAPGNRDCLSADSFYQKDLLRIRELPDWPSNVHVFRGDAFTTFHHPSQSDVSFTGRAYLSDVPNSRKSIEQPVTAFRKRDQHSSAAWCS